MCPFFLAIVLFVKAAAKPGASAQSDILAVELASVR